MSPEEGEALKRKYARLERLIIYPERLSKIAKDIVDHFNKRRKRCQEIERKAMVVTISKVAVRLYEEIVKHPNAPSVAVGPKMVTVVDMLLTGFDVPCLHTMYFDKPMKDHSLVQAIAGVNRVFKKPGGLIVDYIGIAD